jgi:3-oxoacyl-[acyl-carrier-protein] synthase II
VTALAGIGWVLTRRYGAARRALAVATEGDASVDCVRGAHGVVGRPPKNYPRFDVPSRLAFCATALAIWDAGPEAAEPPRETGLVGTGPRGCLDANAAYFRDFVSCGRTLGRGNLFIYTLPTSPLAEAAIHFRLGGPLLHVSAEPPSLAVALEMAVSLMEAGAAPAMAAVCIEAEAAVGCCLTPNPPAGSSLPTLDDFARLVRQYPAVAQLVGALTPSHGEPTA